VLSGRVIHAKAVQFAKNFPDFDQGKRTADDYAKTAARYIDDNLTKG